jgi:ATP-binding cassette subfamily B (MDR/TAP) protein 1
MIYAAYALAFWYDIHLFARGQAKSSGQIITTLFSIIIGTNAFAQLAGYLGSFLTISSAGGELLKVIDARSDIDPK